MLKRGTPSELYYLRPTHTFTGFHRNSGSLCADECWPKHGLGGGCAVIHSR